jgi:hypothetical protein
MKNEPSSSENEESDTDYGALLQGFDPAPGLLSATPTKSGSARAKEELITPPSNKAPKPRGDYHPGWTVPKASRHGSMVTMTHDATGRAFTVPQNKFHKACVALDSSTFTFLLAPGKGDCRCSRVCPKLPWGVSDHTMRNARLMAISGNFLVSHGGRGLCKLSQPLPQGPCILDTLLRYLLPTT